MTQETPRHHSLASHLLAGLAAAAFGAGPAPSATATPLHLVVALCGHAGTVTIPLPGNRSRGQDCPSGGCHSACLRRHSWLAEDADE